MGRGGLSLFGACDGSRDQMLAEERERAIQKEREQAGILFPEDNSGLKNATVVGNDQKFYKDSPWEQQRRVDARKLQETAPKPAPAPKDATKPKKALKKDKTASTSIFMSFRNMFEDRGKAKKNADVKAADEPAAVEVDEKAKNASEYVRPKTLRKEDSVFAFKNKFESQQVGNDAEKTYKSEFEKEREQLADLKGVNDRQRQLESNEARMLMTDEFKVKVGLEKSKINYQPRGGKIRRLQHDLAGSTAHFNVGVKLDDD